MVADDSFQDNQRIPDEPPGSIESDFVDWLAARHGDRPHPVALGDDAAVIAGRPDTEIVLAKDLLAEGTHFPNNIADASKRQLFLIGQKAVGVNLSDLAAMGAEPTGCLVALVVPEALQLNQLKQLYAGVESICGRFEVELLGGDTNAWAGGLVVSTTVVGSVPTGTAWRRDGGQPGDLLAVTGPLGGSILGRHWCETPRLREAQLVRRHATVHAAIDISDGLSLDLWRMATASGCGAVVRADDIPIADSAQQLSRSGSGKSPLQHALTDGEDFELLLAIAPESLPRIASSPELADRLKIIGRLEETPGLWLESKHGRRPIAPRGYLHGSENPTGE